jgi:hypothetical protein
MHLGTNKLIQDDMVRESQGKISVANDRGKLWDHIKMNYGEI